MFMILLVKSDLTVPEFFLFFFFFEVDLILGTKFQSQQIVWERIDFGLSQS